MAASVSLPASDDPAYASLGALGQHVLGAAGGYMVWMCEVLELPDPGIQPAPEATAIVRDAEEYMEHVLERCGPRYVTFPATDWRLPSTHRDGKRATASTRCWSTPSCTPSAMPSSWMS